MITEVQNFTLANRIFAENEAETLRGSVRSINKHFTVVEENNLVKMKIEIEADGCLYLLQ